MNLTVATSFVEQSQPFHASLSAMGLFTSILISIVASVVGVQADVTFWKTSTEVMPANTVWSTETYTETAWSTYIPPAVTISVPYTVTSVLEKNYTDIVSIPYTVTSIIEKDYTTTLTKVVISTVEQPTTITIPPTTVTVFTTSTLTGLVTCPTRIINPTYTTSTPLPDDYTWGCPPGTLCQPPQINCNFEQNPPADTYYCSPDECVPAPPLPSFTPAPIGGGTCGPYPTVPGYFNFDPEYFGLSYSIFVDGGDYAETCSGCVMSTVMPISQISDGQPQAPTLVSVCETSTTQPQAPSTTWALVTTISDGQPQGPWITTAARLARRADPPLPSACYEYCNECLNVAEQSGKQTKLCPADSPFSAAFGNCQTCLLNHKADTTTEAGAVLPSLYQFTSYCNSVLKAVTSQAITTPSTLPTTSASATTPTSTSQKTSSTSSLTTVSTSTPTQSSTVTSAICAVSQISDGQPQECTSTSTTALATFSGAAGHAMSPPSIFWSSPMGWALLLFVNALPI